MLEERSAGTYRWDAEKLALGELVWLMSRSPLYGGFPIVSLRLYAEPPILTGQYRLFYDERRQAVGYVLWAAVDPEISAQIRIEKDYKLRLSEWNEGEDIWITDFFALRGYVFELAHEVRRMFNGSNVFYVRRWPNGRESVVRRLVF